MTSFLNYVTATLRALYACRGSYMYKKYLVINIGFWAMPMEKEAQAQGSKQQEHMSPLSSVW